MSKDDQKATLYEGIQGDSQADRKRATVLLSI